MTDLSGAHWVTMFEESAQKLLGKSAAELGTLLEEDVWRAHFNPFAIALSEVTDDFQKDAYYAVFENVRFKSFIFRVRSKMETYNVRRYKKKSNVGSSDGFQEEQKIKWTVYDVRPVPWDNYIDALNKTIQALTAL